MMVEGEGSKQDDGWHVSSDALMMSEKEKGKKLMQCFRMKRETELDVSRVKEPQRTF